VARKAKNFAFSAFFAVTTPHPACATLTRSFPFTRPSRAFGFAKLLSPFPKWLEVSPSGAEKGITLCFGRFPRASGHQLLLLMQQILAFRVSFVDLGRAFVKLRPALFRWNSPCEIESAIILN
jgi:hypothetical protein